MKFDYVLFDLDGTLTDSYEGITRSVAYALESFGISVENRHTLKCFIGPPLIYSFMEYYGFSEEQAIAARDKYRERYHMVGWQENELVEGAIPLLSALSENGVKIALATSKPEFFARKILDYFDVSKYFAFIGGAEMDGGRQSKPDVIRYALENLGASASDRVAMVGDRNYDISGAKTVGISSIGVLTGFGDRKELEEAGADYVAEKLLDIRSIVL